MKLGRRRYKYAYCGEKKTLKSVHKSLLNKTCTHTHAHICIYAYLICSKTPTLIHLFLGAWVRSMYLCTYVYICCLNWLQRNNPQIYRKWQVYIYIYIWCLLLIHININFTGFYDASVIILWALVTNTSTSSSCVLVYVLMKIMRYTHIHIQTYIFIYLSLFNTLLALLVVYINKFTSVYSNLRFFFTAHTHTHTHK